ncbi:uncharacterized protein involved in outer membrane biogenesis [Oxalobacteraceae bacterium GrIS 2.11]
MPVRLFKILLWFTALIISLLLIALALALTFDWNRAKPYLNRNASESTGRDFAVRGDLQVHLISGAQPGAGWMQAISTLPLLQISADDVVLSNPSWAQVGRDMATVHKVVLTLKPLALLGRQVMITDLSMDTPLIALERRADRSNSWTMPDNGPSSWAVQIRHLNVADGTMHFIDPHIKLDMHAELNSVPAASTSTSTSTSAADQPGKTAQRFDLQFVLGGSYNHAPVTGQGQLGSILTLEDKSTVFPVSANLQIGANKIEVNGVITDPRAPSGINIELALAGASLADLYPLTGVLLPETAAYQTRGNLVGQKAHNNWDWTYQNFVGTVGASELAGTLHYFSHLPRPILRGTITSNQLRLDDLGPIIGIDSKVHKALNNDPPPQDPNKALPTGQFHTSEWSALDADVKFTGKHLIRTHDIPLENIIADIHLNDSVISLTPLYFGIAGGDVTSNIVLDGRTPNIDAQIKAAVRNVKLRELFPKLQSMNASFGEINGDAALTGHGNSIADLLGTSNGEFVATVNQGSVSRYILEEAGLNLANVLFVKLFGDKQVQLNCLVSDFAVKNGVANVRRFVVDTDDATINITGDIDMAREALNLDLRPNTKSLRIFSLRTPLYAKGTFEHPDIGPYKTPIALRVGAAVALAVLAPPAAALATVNLGTTPTIDCPSELGKALHERSVSKSAATAAPAERVSKTEIQKVRAEK